MNLRRFKVRPPFAEFAIKSKFVFITAQVAAILSCKFPQIAGNSELFSVIRLKWEWLILFYSLDYINEWVNTLWGWLSIVPATIKSSKWRSIAWKRKKGIKHAHKKSSERYSVSHYSHQEFVPCVVPETSENCFFFNVENQLEIFNWFDAWWLTNHFHNL